MRGNLFGIFLSALNASSQFLVRSIIAKFFAFFVLFFVVQGFIGVLMSHIIPANTMNGQNLDSMFGGLTEGVWYFADLFAFTLGFPMVLSALVIRFMIRRIPVVG